MKLFTRFYWNNNRTPSSLSPRLWGNLQPRRNFCTETCLFRQKKRICFACNINHSAFLLINIGSITLGADVLADQYEMRCNVTADLTGTVTFRVTLVGKRQSGRRAEPSGRPELRPCLRLDPRQQRSSGNRQSHCQAAEHKVSLSGEPSQSPAGRLLCGGLIR
jgi:hypothetical protein